MAKRKFLLNRVTDEIGFVTFQHKILGHNGGTHECITTTVTSHTAKIPKTKWLSQRVITDPRKSLFWSRHAIFVSGILFTVLCNSRSNWQCINFYAILKVSNCERENMWQYFSGLHIQYKQSTIRTSLVADIYTTCDRWQHYLFGRSKVVHTEFKHVLRLTSRSTTKEGKEILKVLPIYKF
jgi:hypothetical protein